MIVIAAPGDVSACRAIYIVCVLFTGWSEPGECANWSGEERVTEPVVSRHSPLRMLKALVVEKPGSKDFRDMWLSSPVWPVF